MKISTHLSGLALLTYALTAGAHAHLQKASPADGSVIAAPPSSIVLSFDKPVRLTALWIRKADGQQQNLRPLPTEQGRQVSVAAPHLQPGRYEVSWRVFSEDGHVAAGQIHFTLSPKARSGPAGGSSLTMGPAGAARPASRFELESRVQSHEWAAVSPVGGYRICPDHDGTHDHGGHDVLFLT
jgi:methionine-rich copper-binding protein CopC